MSKNKSSDMLGLLLAIIGIIIVLGVFLTPILLVAVSIYGYRKTAEGKRRIVKFKNSRNDPTFWLTNDEIDKFCYLKDSFSRLMNQSSEISKEIRQAEQYADSKNISRNKDGNISARSDIGRQLRDHIAKNQAEKDNIWDKQRYIAQHLEYITSLPKERRNQFVRGYSLYLAGVFGFLAWLVALIISAHSLPLELGIALKNILLFFLHTDSSEVIKAVAVNTGVALGATILAFILGRLKSTAMAPEPDEFTIEIAKNRQAQANESEVNP